MAIDYSRYADGEAALGWLNATLRLETPEPRRGEPVLKALANALRDRLLAQGAEIAHIKMTLSSLDGACGVAALNIVRNDIVPELGQELAEPVRRARLIVNARAEADPERLHEALLEAIATAEACAAETRLELEHEERFRPAPPQPKWRMSDAEHLKRFAE